MRHVVIAAALAAAAWPGPRALRAHEPEPIKMTVRPAAEPEPALRYELQSGIADQTPGNAALVYLTAIAQLDQMDAKQMEKVSEALAAEPFKADAAAAALAPYEQVLKYADRAARCEQCDWQLPLRTDGFMTLMPHLSRVRDIARLVALRSRVEIAAGRTTDALTSIQTLIGTARHCASGLTLIECLVGAAIDTMALMQLEQLVQSPAAPNLYWALSGLPAPMIDIGRSLRLEKDWLHLTYPRLRDAAKYDPAHPDAVLEEEIRRLWALPGSMGLAEPRVGWPLMNFGVAMRIYPAARQALIAEGRPAAVADRIPVQVAVTAYVLQRYEHHRDQMFKWFRLPYPEAHERLRQADEAFRGYSNDPVEGWPFTMLLPGLSKVYLTSARLDRRVAALRCIEAVRMHAAAHDGAPPAKLANVTVVSIPGDPVTGKPFEYSAADGSFTLRGPAPAGGHPTDELIYKVTIRK